MEQPMTCKDCFQAFENFSNSNPDGCILDSSTATWLWFFAPWGLLVWICGALAAIYFPCRYLRKRGLRLPGPYIVTKISQVKTARKEEKLRKEQEARTRAMRLSGLEVEMGNMERDHDGMKDCETA